MKTNATPSSSDPSAPAATSPSSPSPSPSLFQQRKSWLATVASIAAIAVAGLAAWQMLRPTGPGPGLVSSNGRLEATEINVAAKLGGRVQDLLVDEGEFVKASQVLGHMQVQTLLGVCAAERFVGRLDA